MKALQRLHYGYDLAGNVLTLANNVPVPGSNEMGGPTSFTFGYDDLYAEYEAEHQNIKITPRKAKTVDEHIKNLDTNLAAGSGLADIEAMEIGWIYNYLAKADKFVDLRDYGANDLGNRWLDWKVAGATTTDGKIIGYGTDIGPEAICYRRDLFAKAGLPTDPSMSLRRR